MNIRVRNTDGYRHRRRDVLCSHLRQGSVTGRKGHNRHTGPMTSLLRGMEVTARSPDGTLRCLLISSTHFAAAHAHVVDSTTAFSKKTLRATTRSTQGVRSAIRSGLMRADAGQRFKSSIP